jgi:CheY-like chemotaxis protein
VEDNEINRQVATELLREEGFFISSAANGRIALDMITASVETEAHDVVLMDLQMPVMDGYEATRRIRADERFDDLPIIAMTADAMSGVRDSVLDIGMNDYVTKPIDPGTLFRALAKWIVPRDRELPPGYSAMEGAPAVADDSLPVEGLEGIDVADGLARVGGNTALYRKLLLKFSEGQAQVVDVIRRSLAAGDMELAERTAHTLKGVSGNIGATGLHHGAVLLDEAMKKKDAQRLEPLLQQVAADLHIVLDAIRRGVSGEETEVTASEGPMDTEKVAELIGSLRLLLDNYDAKASDIMARLLDHVTDSEAAAHLKTLKTHIGNYDYEDALESLEDLSKTLGL